MSGSEDGKPVCWDIDSRETVIIDTLEYEIQGPVSCVDWNNYQHMIAVAGYGENYPIAIYVFEDEFQDLDKLILDYSV